MKRGRLAPDVTPETWRCPVCGSDRAVAQYAVAAGGSEGGVDAEAFRPSSERFGTTAGRVVRCVECGHGSLAEAPPVTAMAEAYTDAIDPVSLREEEGQVETARRALERIEEVVRPGLACDLGCWTGSFLVAARERGWDTVGVEPSAWASGRARERGLDVRTTTLEEHGLSDGSCRLVSLCDVIEHVIDPGAAVDVAAALLEPRGALFLTLPDAGSRLARLMGRRWWSVLPMHVQYFTRASLTRLLDRRGFAVVSVDTHAKVFSARYYAERLESYSGAVQRLVTKALDAAGQADRLVAPDFRDRMAVIAVKR